MSLFSRISPRVWMVFPICALVFLVLTDQRRMQRVEDVSALAGRVELTDAIDSGSSTGYVHGQRELIVPERNEKSFHWIAETQQMIARGESRVRWVDYENAPFGRE